MDWLHQFLVIPQEGTFTAWLVVIKRLIAFLGILIIFAGALIAIWHLFYKRQRIKKEVINRIDLVRLKFGRMIILGLEFIVAADVIETTTAPDYYSVGILASLVGIRTLLTYFMNRELTALTKK